MIYRMVHLHSLLNVVTDGDVKPNTTWCGYEIMKDKTIILSAPSGFNILIIAGLAGADWAERGGWGYFVSIFAY